MKETSLPGTTGISNFLASDRALDLFPIASITSGEGPININPELSGLEEVDYEDNQDLINLNREFADAQTSANIHELSEINSLLFADLVETFPTLTNISFTKLI